MVELPDPRPTAAKDAAAVQAMFDRVAPRYDLANTVFSLGRDRYWRRVAVRAVGPRAGERVLDLAAGTGALSVLLEQAGARVVALDASAGMTRTGAEREGSRETLRWAVGDGRALPFADRTFDAVTIAFGLRNVGDVGAGLRELARVTRPGGRLVVLEFSSPTWPPFRAAYLRYLVGAMPRLARWLTSDPAAYTYLAESIQAWPDQRGLAALLDAGDWRDVGWRSLTGGIVAVHRARRP